MLKIKQNKWRGWGRLFLKIGALIGIFYVLFGVLFGVARCRGEMDGDLALYCRICREYEIGDAILLADNTVVEYGETDGGVVAGKVIAKLSVRGFVDEGDR